jgi:FMN-dependent NADH-azoreductase
MSNVLLVLTSPSLGASVSTKFATELAAKIASKPGNSLTTRDVGAKPLPHVDADQISGTRSGKTDMTAHEKAGADRSMEIVNEVLAADTIVIGAPLYNFGPSTNLKGWIDHLAVPSKTFSYSATGPEGLVKGKKVYVITTSGGIYSTGTGDFLTPWLIHALGLFGITDVEVIRMEGLGYGPEAVEKATSTTSAKIAAIAA